MPFWVILLGGAALVWWLSRGQGAGALFRYKLNSPAAYYTADPSTSQGASSAGQLDAGTIVNATANPPILSADSSFELVQVPNGNTVWVSTADLTQA